MNSNDYYAIDVVVVIVIVFVKQKYHKTKFSNLHLILVGSCLLTPNLTKQLFITTKIIQINPFHLMRNHPHHDSALVNYLLLAHFQNQFYKIPQLVLTQAKII